MDSLPTKMKATRASAQTRRLWLVAIEFAIAVSAIGGGVYGLRGARGVSRSWLSGSPFHNYVLPSLILLVAVAGSMVTAVVVEVAGYSRAAEVSGAAGLILLGWLVGEVLVIPFSWLQPTFAVLALVVIGLAAQRWHLERPERSSRSG